MRVLDFVPPPSHPAIAGPQGVDITERLAWEPIDLEVLELDMLVGVMLVKYRSWQRLKDFNRGSHHTTSHYCTLMRV